MENKFLLYGLYCPITNELRYVGVTTGTLNDRLSGHLRNPTNGKIAYWFKTLNKSDLKPIIKLIKEYDNYVDLLNSEINEIKKNRELGVNLMNIADGGDINPMFGKTHTLEARGKISLNNKGLKRTDIQKIERKKILSKLWSDDEWSTKIKDKMSKNMMGNSRAEGYKHTNETKKLLSELHIGNQYSLGYKHSDEAKKIMSLNNSGENNPMFGKSLPKDVLSKRSVKVKKEGTFKGKNNPNFRFTIGEEELIKLYIKENKKIDEIAYFYGCHRTVISKKIKEFSIIKEPSNIYKLDIVKIKNYINNGLNLVEIGNIFGCSNKIIHKYIKKHG